MKKKSNHPNSKGESVFKDRKDGWGNFTTYYDGKLGTYALRLIPLGNSKAWKLFPPNGIAVGVGDPFQNTYYKGELEKIENGKVATWMRKIFSSYMPADFKKANPTMFFDGLGGTLTDVQVEEKLNKANTPTSLLDKIITVKSVDPSQRVFYWLTPLCDYIVATIHDKKIKFDWPDDDLSYDVPIQDIIDGTADFDVEEYYVDVDIYAWILDIVRISEEQQKVIAHEKDKVESWEYYGKTGKFQFSYLKGDDKIEMVFPSLKFSGTYKNLNALHDLLCKIEGSGQLCRALETMFEKNKDDRESNKEN